MKYIYFHKETGHYQVGKKIEGKQYSFGTYDCLEEAKKARDYFIKHGWNISERLRFTRTRFIRKLPSGNYSVLKQYGNGKSESYGTFPTLEEAEYQVILCKRFNWDIRLKPFDCMKYIVRRVHPTGKVVWRIAKQDSDGHICYYGSFNNLDDAKFERDMLISSDWDYEILCSLFDESFEGVKFLDGKHCKKNFIYKPPNGRIDYGMI